MLRSRQEKEQLVRKFEEILPYLKTQEKFGWIQPECEKDPVYKIYPDTSTQPSPFKPVTVNIKTGWHSELVYLEDQIIYRVPEGITPISNDWVDFCYRAGCGCNPTARII